MYVHRYVYMYGNLRQPLLSSQSIAPTSADGFPLVVQFIHIATLLMVNPTGNNQTMSCQQQHSLEQLAHIHT